MAYSFQDHLEVCNPVASTSTCDAPKFRQWGELTAACPYPSVGQKAHVPTAILPVKSWFWPKSYL